MRERFARSILLSSLFFVVGCATGIQDDQPCSGDLDCPNGYLCDPIKSICTIIPLPGNNQNNSNNQNNLNNQNNVNNDVDMGSDQGDEDDMQVAVCNPTCAPNEACDNGTCVEACNPACQAPEICTVDGCALPTCIQKDDLCDLNTKDQGSFWCLQDENDEGRCFEKCDAPLAASTCGTGNYCLTVDAGASEYACIASECSTQADCSGSTCLEFDNSVGLCFPAGATALGGACNPDATNSCEPGTYCRRLVSNSSAGECSAICDPWNGASCGVDDCALFTNRAGLCTDELDVQGVLPFQVCATPGEWCSDATQCFNLGAQNGCLKYCRGGGIDCAGLDLNGDPAICDNYVFAGDRTLGLCFPECDPLDADPCGAGANCVNNICRTVCTAASVVQDCCNGSTPCDFACVNNFCE